jgi:hypothetical protein
MTAIRVLDNTGGIGTPGHCELGYTVPDAKRSVWTGFFPVEGTVAAFMCEGCGRILLYGKPREPKRT